MGDADGAKTALILSGGGAYAAYEVGVMKALFGGRSAATGHAKLRAEIFLGTSMGAVNAATIVSRPDLDLVGAVNYLQDLWLNRYASHRDCCRQAAIRIRGDPSGYLSWSCGRYDALRPFAAFGEDMVFFAREALARTFAFATSSEPLARRALGLIDASGLIDKDNFAQIVRESVDLAGIRRSQNVLRITATNWRTGQLKLFGNEDMTDPVGHRAIFASATFPGLRPVLIDGEAYVDGAYLLNAPTSPARDAGAITMHVVYMDPDIRNIPLERFESVFDVMDKLFHIMTATIFERDIELIKDINGGLAVLDRAADGPRNRPEWEGVLRLASWLKESPGRAAPFRPLTIHCYHPTDDLGGALGLINFDRDHIQQLIERGFRDAVQHDCAESGCVFPT